LVPFAHDEERVNLVDYSYLVPGEKAIAILSSPSVIDDNRFSKFLTSFDSHIWILILISYLLLTIINIFITRAFKFKLNIALDFVFIFLGRGTIKNHLVRKILIFFFKEIPMKSYHHKYLITIWCFASFIIINHFEQDFLSILISREVQRIESIDQLIYENKIRILVEKNSVAHKVLEKVDKNISNL
jgi:hypothetical protein